NRNLTGSLGSKLFIDSSDVQVNFDPPDHVTRLEMQRLKIFVTVPPTPLTEAALASFNFDDLNSQKIVYLYHDDTTGWDQFEVVAQWDSIRSLPARVHVHMWAPFASMAPRVVVNRELRAFQDSPNPFGLEHLRAEDDDTPDRGLTYRVTAVQNCYVAFADNSMRRIDQFTQDDIAAGRMLFVHTGLSSFGSFNFYVQDSSGTQSQQYQFYATTQPLSIIMRSRLPSLEAFPNLMHILSPDHLLAVTNNGYYARDIVYRIKGNGALGRLGIVTRNPTTGAMTLEATREFTQSQVNASTVAYNHSHAYSLGSHAEYVDRVLFDVTARGAPSLERQELRIVISDRHINRFNQRLLLNMNPLTVLEGGNVSLTVRNIDGASFARLMPTNVLLFVITELPKYGIFTFSGNNISIGDTFVRDDLVKANLVYYHDGSDTEVDELGFYVREQTDSQLTPQSMAKQPAVLRIQVTPVNDQIFKVDRMNSVVKVLRGRFVKIGPDQLSVIDQDSQSEQIVYRVRRSPTFGQLRINSRACLSFPRAPEEPTCEFSQADVNAGQVVYLHLGNNGSLDSFYFCVSDSFSQPEHKPFCQTFEIHVSPVSITFLSTHDLLIRQGYNSATLTPVQLNASCNDPQDPIWYTVTRTPEYGQLYRDKLGVFNFSQADVDKGLIRYQLTRFVSSLDSMQFSVVTKSRSAVLPDRQLVIRVRAGVSVSPVILHECPGEMQTSRLTRNHIDDRELKNKLRYEAPTRYRIVKQAVNALISPASFTQSDIDAGAVQAVGLVGQRGRFLTPGVAAAEIEVTTPLANVAPGAFNLTVRLVLCQGQNASEARGKEFTNSEDDAARVLGLSRTNFVTL
uniref:LAM_G_DOMAIN domain-containing protein n=1 Tax=Macrostomum lignano TaxID=282301 RepID=A0A1I8J0J9_9PLAT